MTYIITPLQGILLMLLSIIAPVVTLVCLPFIKWDDAPSVGPQRSLPPTPTIMGDWPQWLAWLRTPDQRLPGDTGIIEVRETVEEYGKWWAAWIWAGWRNTWMGLAAWMGNETSGYIAYDTTGYIERTDQFGKIWRYRLQIGPLVLMTGHNVYRLLDGRYWTAPVFTARWV